jgi:hypothetical protein
MRPRGNAAYRAWRTYRIIEVAREAPEVQSIRKQNDRLQAGIKDSGRFLKKAAQKFLFNFGQEQRNQHGPD